MNGTSFGSSNPNNHITNLQNDNQVPVPHGIWGEPKRTSPAATRQNKFLICVELNEAVENEWAGLITSLGRNNGKGIVIHEKPAGLQSNKNPTIMQGAGWSMVGMNGTSFGSSNPDNHLANLQNDNQESGGSPSPKGLLQPQLDIRSFCAQLNGAVENERAGLITSLGGNKGKGIVIHEEPAGLQRNKVSSGKLSVEGKGKGILIEENVHSGKFSSKPYICANFQNPTIMRNAGWSMVGMNGTSFGSSNPNNHLANLQNDNQVPAPHGVCTNTLICLKTPCIILAKLL
nr:hypothetical protein Iba_chr04cCG7710 [Ipomoea batatas]